MPRLSRLLLSAVLPFCLHFQTQYRAVAEEPETAAVHASVWSSKDAVHAVGFPDARENKKGVLSLDAGSLTFTSAATKAAIPRSAITAVSAGNDRVELWGTGGRILRMAIPEGGGLAAGAMMHHRVDMLTVEFLDPRGGMHSAVFYLPANEATSALTAFSQVPFAAAAMNLKGCGTNPVEPGSVLVEAPDWGAVEVPAAYRALAYEHLLERLRTARGVRHVYRYGEINAGSACPQYTIHVAVQTFKKGNQVVRAATGPIGMFTSATEITLNVRFQDHAGKLDVHQQIKATVRTESESTGVADKLAKTLTKHYVAIVRTADAGDTAKAKS
ncbi:MAG: hypothetical protein PW789_08660 [Edaphobacter sp.]|uniref:hypothetical protein n=1 Tax=Edaphobacter sp. TaxID=1934404 RepID=UPI00239AFAE0|nr:hypothetical protein [Edaphobacter sp.]MDE1176666.1 hypothetical protein [Edaphobacter sp.]